MASGTIADSINKDSTKAVYQKTSDLLTVFQNHVDNGCQHCLSILKSGLGNQPNPATDAGEHPKVQLRNVHRKVS